MPVFLLLCGMDRRMLQEPAFKLGADWPMPILSRRQALSSVGAALMAKSIAPVAAAAPELRPIAPAEAGFASDLEARLDKAVADKRVWNLHGVVVVREGRLVLERYFEGDDNARGRPFGKVAFTAETPHDMRSVSKGVVGLLYGIALAQGKVPPPEAPLFASFPEYADLAGSAGRDRLTIHHVLTMTMGTDWDETSIPYSNPANSEIAMDRAPDRFRYILERRPVREPGRRWSYCGGATALLGRIIAKGADKPLHDFAREQLFDPLGLGPTEWLTDRKGEPYAASGLRMTPRDLARLGMMMVGGGEAAGRRVVPSAWLERGTAQIVSVDELRRYGYHWYVGDFAFGKPIGWAPGNLERWWVGFGEGGQRLFVLPGLKLVVAITAGNYGADDQWIPPTRVMREVVLAGLV
jgi:CubicO group peptidase (beta-lactamase class C family)